MHAPEPVDQRLPHEARLGGSVRPRRRWISSTLVSRSGSGPGPTSEPPVSGTGRRTRPSPRAPAGPRRAIPRSRTSTPAISDHRTHWRRGPQRQATPSGSSPVTGCTELSAQATATSRTARTSSTIQPEACDSRSTRVKRTSPPTTPWPPPPSGRAGSGVAGRR